MCGILGAISDNLSKDNFHSALQQLTFRGPDAEGVEVLDGKVFLGHKRLSILDLSELGNQPMSDDMGRYTIAFNGEVYNFKILRNELESKGYVFRSNTDTEVVLKLFVEHGTASFDMLEGMFGLAIYDKAEKKLVVARDPLGIKPVYYYQNDKDFAYASELKAIKALSIFSKDVDPIGITGFLQFGALPGEQTLFKGLKLLAPGHFIEYSNDNLSIHQYYQVPQYNGQKITDYEEAKSELFDLMLSSVQKRMIADVPLGAFLSGGIDSSAVVAMMREAGVGDLKTFSISFEEKEFSEGAIAKIVADKYQTTHSNCVVTVDDLKKDFHRIVNYMDVPTVDGINTYFVSKFTRESGTIVALSGVGGDELFGGYDTFNFVPKLVSMKSKTKLVPNAAIDLASKVIKRDKVKKALEFLSAKGNPFGNAYSASRGLLPNDLIKGVVNDLPIFDKYDYLSNLIGGQDYQEVKDIVSFYELRGYMLNQLLRDTDVMSMSHSLEVRVPLIDKNLVDFAFRLPSKFKNGKQIIIDTLGEKLPEEVYNRPKQGFLFPFPVWIKNELKQDLLDVYYTKSDYFNQAKLETMWDQFLKGNVHWSRIWAIAVLKSKLAQ